jgi:hypothetical protein
MKLTDKQYQALLDLFNECNAAFMALPAVWKCAFYDRLYGRN